MKNQTQFLKKTFLITVFIISIQSLFALNDTLYLIRDTISINQLLVSQTTFCEENEFSLQNVILKADVNEIAELIVANTDTIDHSFTINGIIDQVLPAGLTSIVTFQVPETGTYRYFSTVSQGQLMGASGILQIGYQGEISYFWNLNDINNELSHTLSDGSQSAIPSEYNPNVFTINGYSFPNTTGDPNGYVQQNVGEHIYISIINSGNMAHVLHFHGYHVEILNAQEFNKQVGWSKDTFPLKKGEAMTVLLVPDQEGEYPVHDHNLIAVTNAGFYPGGMITRLNIAP